MRSPPSPSRIASAVIVAYAIAATTSACGGRERPTSATIDDAGEPTPRAHAPRSFACDEQFGVGVCHGTLEPTALGPGIRPVGHAGQLAHHYVCRPASRTPNGRLLVHLVDRGDSPTRLHRFALRACALGFAAIVPAYENGADIGAKCHGDSSCSEAAHAAALVEGANALDHRVRTLLAALVEHDAGYAPWADWSARWSAHDTRAVVVSGHARGADHALYLAKDFAFERAILLAGPTERVAWIDGYAAVARTTKILGYVHADDAVDGYANVRASWQALGIDSPSCAFSNGPCAPGCRAVVSPAAGCNGYYAHLAVAVATYGANCEPGVGPSTNTSTWAHLLDAP